MAGLFTLLIVLGLALYVCWLMLQPFFNVLLWAVVLAVVFYPMHRRIRQGTGSPSLAAALSTLLVVLLIVLPVTFITIAVVRELTGAAANLQGGVQWLTDPNVPVVGWLLEKARDYVDIDRRVGPAVRCGADAGLGRRSWPAARSWSSAARSAPWCRWCWSSSRCSTCSGTATGSATPSTRCCRSNGSQTHSITVRTREVIAATLYGVLVISAIQGTLGTFIFWALGLPSPLLWGVVMFFLSMIPMAGAFLVWVPAAAFLALSGRWRRRLSWWSGACW